jgi:manganese oxidase
MHGLGNSRGVLHDSVRIESGASHTFTFRATAPGTFYYAGRTGKAGVFTRLLDDSQLHGAIVVDPPARSAASRAANDRIFVMSIWGIVDRASPTGLRRATMAINGRSWPHTERIDMAQGDSAHWRWINLSQLHHPMHLHGFYFSVNGKGDGTVDTAYAIAHRRQAVTEVMDAGATMEIAWSPDRAGNWLFHCHMAGHMSHDVSLGTFMGVPNSAPRMTDPHGDHTTGAPVHDMAGLVLGIHVAPKHRDTGVAASPRRERSLRLWIQSKPGVFGLHDGYAYAVGLPLDSTHRARYGMPGPTLVLRQGEPVAITILNRSSAPAAVHWHGIELESLPDGVPGWSGSGLNVLRAIPVGDSLVVRFTPPRAGTFMYHSHFNETRQIAAGLYGPIVVLPTRRMLDTKRDKVLIFGDDGPTDNVIFGPFPHARVNGRIDPDTLELRAGVTYRLRLINIRTDYMMSIALNQGATGARWRIVAKDGAARSAASITESAARLDFGPGETYDVEFTPPHAGDLSLEYSALVPQQRPSVARRTAVPLRVRDD